MNQATAAPAWDRFAQWGAWPARVLLAVAAILLVLAAITPLTASMDGTPAEVPSLVGGEPSDAAEHERDEDLAFYDRVIDRIESGESYYDFIVEEQRARAYPVRPGLAVRLPTLAYIHAWLGEPGLIAMAIVLMGVTVWAWWKRLGDEPGGKRRQRIGAALMLMGGSLGLNRYYFVLHELWAGMLLALAFGLHRPGRWGWPLAVAALALAIREHVLPFVLLMGAMAAWRRDWKEAAAWSALVIVFLLAIAWHFSLVVPQVLPSDPESPDWLVLRGMAGWLGNVVLSSNLRFLPHEIAGPMVVLMALGWAGWKSPAGTTGTLLYLGYALAFMLAGRANNFYWGAVVAPAMFIGLAFLPMALVSLVNAARGKA
ncbi:hypothetical protein K3174_05540 [Qipengyuania sp. 6D47A]|uniref:DUF2029 domain-containing protein n=1 Tax=Qipengyuania qiaonensis TaxID=2867240 RepID=A0ABS7J7B9_9SPHN|nr:hypothetical protein [Qipengyuania qiaonensis]